MLEFFVDFWHFMPVREKLWLAPIIIAFQSFLPEGPQ